MALKIQKDFNLSRFNTFGVPAKAKEFVEISGIEDLLLLRNYLKANPELPFLILGAGSDVLFKGDFQGLVAHMGIQGLDFLEETDEFSFVKAYAGENWHSFVRRMLDSGHLGFENLAMIPGTVGAAPVQNIGAYGLEIAERIENVECFDLVTGEFKNLSTQECDFRYRDSIFKKKENNKLVIVSVTFKIPKQYEPCVGYRELASEIEANRIVHITASDVYACVTSLRKRKLPDPTRVGNAGSFFKNPIVDKEKLNQLLEQNPSMIFYPLAGGRYKLSAAWLIDNSGLKGIRLGDVGVWDKQPLVLVNYGQARGVDVFDLAQEVKYRVKNCFGVRLEPEVVILG